MTKIALEAVLLSYHTDSSAKYILFRTKFALEAVVYVN